MKKFKRFSIFLLVGVLLFSLLFPACGTNTGNHSNTDTTSESSDLSNNEEAPTGPFYTLEEAYTCGLLTKEDLEKIAAYRDSYTQSTDTLSDELIAEIKEARAKEIREEPDSMFPDLQAEYILLTTFYGFYNNYPVGIVKNGKLVTTSVSRPCTVEIDGVAFHFDHRRYVANLVLYKPTNLN